MSYVITEPELVQGAAQDLPRSARKTPTRTRAVPSSNIREGRSPRKAITTRSAGCDEASVRSVKT